MQQLQRQQPTALRAGAALWANGAARGGRRPTAVRKKPYRHTCKLRDEVIEQRQYNDQPREPRQYDPSRPPRDNNRRGGGRSRSDEEWRKYANQKIDSDNPFKDL